MSPEEFDANSKWSDSSYRTIGSKNLILAYLSGEPMSSDKRRPVLRSSASLRASQLWRLAFAISDASCGKIYIKKLSKYKTSIKQSMYNWMHQIASSGKWAAYLVGTQWFITETFHFMFFWKRSQQSVTISFPKMKNKNINQMMVINFWQMTWLKQLNIRKGDQCITSCSARSSS